MPASKCALPTPTPTEPLACGLLHRVSRGIIRNKEESAALRVIVQVSRYVRSSCAPLISCRLPPLNTLSDLELGGAAVIDSDSVSIYSPTASTYATRITELKANDNRDTVIDLGTENDRSSLSPLC